MKYAAEYNEVTGTPAGTPLQGAVYEISDPRSNKVVDCITTDARGIAASKPLPLGRYKIVEVTAPAYWQVSGKTFDETLEYSGQIIKVSDYDKPSNLGVVITKRGNAEVLAGSQMRYDFTIANTSNVPLDSYYWHDRIPTDAARATVFTTGTYSARLHYRILYKTNYSGTYQVLASNLITSSSYSFSLNAIPMQAGEYVTDIYLDFGKVPVGFQSTSNPTLTDSLLRVCSAAAVIPVLSALKIRLYSTLALLHDVGKRAIPPEILNKPGTLTEEEFEVMKTHTTQGCDLLERVPELRECEVFSAICDVCRHHHERWDGSGYPDRLAGDSITPWVQVVGLADAFDALVHPRVYKPAFTQRQAEEMIVSGACGIFNPLLLACFAQHIGAIGRAVYASTG